MKKRAIFLFQILLVSLICAADHSCPVSARADCSETEVTAVILASGIAPEQELEIDLLHVFPVWEITDPSDEELLAVVDGLYVDDPHYNIYDQIWTNTVGNFRLYWSMPMDFGTSTIIDWRNASVVFAGTVVWAGLGHVVIPESSSHGFGVPMPYPAPAPSSLEFLPNIFWNDSITPGIVDEVMSELAMTGLMHSFADCGDYSVVAFIYTPSVYITDPEVAKAVILVNGYLSAPWGPEDTDVPPDNTICQLTNYPNPFNPRTTISFELQYPSYTSLEIIDLSGRTVGMPYDGRFLEAGRYDVSWNAATLPSGTYISRLVADGRIETRRMMLIR